MSLLWRREHLIREYPDTYECARMAPALDATVTGGCFRRMDGLRLERLLDELSAEAMLVIDAPHFYAGVILGNGCVIEAAPILRYMVGWTEARVRGYCARKGWTIQTTCT